MSGAILCSREGAIATVMLSNPGKLNAIDAAMWRRLRETMVELATLDDLRCVILVGAEGAFAAGGDLEEFRCRPWPRFLAPVLAAGWKSPALATCASPVRGRNSARRS